MPLLLKEAPPPSSRQPALTRFAVCPLGLLGTLLASLTRKALLYEVVHPQSRRLPPKSFHRSFCLHFMQVSYKNIRMKWIGGIEPTSHRRGEDRWDRADLGRGPALWVGPRPPRPGLAITRAEAR
jgi:hypothetical protein